MNDLANIHLENAKEGRQASPEVSRIKTTDRKTYLKPHLMYQNKWMVITQVGSFPV